MKKISVIIPVYKVEQYLDRCLESVVNQTYTNLEIILVDDGSPDRSPQICDNWAKKDERIKVLHKENGGLSDARNSGLKVASGDYLAFIDSDDFVSTEMYSNMVRALESTGSDIATCGRYVYNSKGISPQHITESEEVFEPNEAIKELLCGGKLEEAAWDKIYKKEVFNGVCFPVGEINEDIVVMPGLFHNAKKIVCTGKPYYYYCENVESITHSLYNEKKRVVLKHMDKVSREVLANYEGMRNAVAVFQARYALGMLYEFEKFQKLQKVYKNDYRCYRQYMKKNFITAMTTRYFPLTSRIKYLLVLTRTFRAFQYIRQIF